MSNFDFISRWQITNSNETLFFLQDASGLTIDWGDGSIDQNSKNSAVHKYKEPGIYTIRVSGSIHRGLFIKLRDKAKLIEVLQFGDLNWYNVGSLFSDCINLKKFVAGNCDTIKIKNLNGLFSECEKLETADLSTFDFSNVKIMSSLFRGCEKLENVDFGKINSSSLTQMFSAFHGTKSLREVDLSEFNTENLIGFSCVFSSSGIRKLDLSNFRPHKINHMNRAFFNCRNLESINFGHRKFSKLKDITKAFYDTPKLKKINLKNFEFDESLAKSKITNSNALVKVSRKYLEMFASSNLNIVTDNKNCNSWLRAIS
jgi:surface protein